VNQSPLHDLHVAFGAKLVEFAGWWMPLRYRGIIEEHNHTRNACSMFDVSHMGRLRVRGADAEAFLQRICTRNLAGTAPGQSRYSHICREDGGILDDVIVSRYDADDWLVVCNGVNREKIMGWFARHADSRKVTVADQTLETAMLALQGPLTRDLMAGLIPVDLSGLKRYRFLAGNFMGVEYTIFRSGYTGEDGYEVILPATAAAMLAPRLLSSAQQPHPHIRPAGLGARDTLRIEAGMPLYGRELSEQWDPLTAGQAWCVDLSVDFIGTQALRKRHQQGLQRTLVGLELEGRRIGRLHTPVFSGPTQVGQITSGTMSPTLGKNIAMALLSADLAAEGTDVQVDFSGRRATATVVKLPFYKRPKEA
jgi:aminomethyltransferase